MKTRLLLIVLMFAVCPALAQQAPDAALTPTNHPRLPADASQLWMVPAGASASAPRPHGAGQADLLAAVKLEIDANYAKALPLLSQSAAAEGPLASYAQYYKGLAELRLGRAADARRTFQALTANAPVGFLAEASALREAECDEALGDQSAAVEIYERLSKTKTTAPDDVLMRLGRAARAAGDLAKATDAFSRTYFEYPFSDLSAIAESELDTLPSAPPCPPRWPGR